MIKPINLPFKKCPGLCEFVSCDILSSSDDSSKVPGAKFWDYSKGYHVYSDLSKFLGSNYDPCMAIDTKFEEIIQVLDKSSSELERMIEKIETEKQWFKMFYDTYETFFIS